MILVLYGVIPTFQPAHFGRVYAAYGGVFIVLSLWWGWGLDGTRPDRLDLVGIAILVVAVAHFIEEWIEASLSEAHRLRD